MVSLTASTGFIGAIAWLFGQIFNFLYVFFSNTFGIENLALCIIVFTIIVKLLLLPFTLKQQKASKINQMIQPEIQKIQKKYRNKQDTASMKAQQDEIQAVYNKYGTSMTSGCLTSFIQLPIIYGLYAVIRNIPAYVPSVKELYIEMAKGIMKVDNYASTLTTFVDDNKITLATRFTKKLAELGTAATTDNVIDIIDKFSVSQFGDFTANVMPQVADIVNQCLPQIDKINTFVLGINISEAPGWKISWALLIPVLSTVFQFLSTKIIGNPSAGAADNEQAQTANTMMQSMTYTMPLLSFFICITLPAGIGIYWTISAMISFVTQLFINLYYKKVDQEKLLERQIEKAKKKNQNKPQKKSFMQKMMDAAVQQEEAQANNSVGNTNLRNYNSNANKSTSNTNPNTSGTTYKKGSIGAKANIMMNYNNQQKEDK